MGRASVVVRWLLILIVLSPFVARGRTAMAATDKREIEARADFVAGRYQPALELYAQLYAETLDPIFLRNVARCHQKLRNAQAAIDTFQDYLRKAKNLKDDERREIQGYIQEMQALLAPPAAPAQPAAPNPPPQPPSSTAQAAPPANAAPSSAPEAPLPASAAGATVSPAAPAATEAGVSPAMPGPPQAASTLAAVAPPEPNTGQHPWRTAGIVTSAAGGALLATGVTLGLIARNDAHAVSQQYDPAKADEGRTAGTFAVVTDVVGAVAVATGLFLALHERSSSAVSIALTAAPAAEGRSALFLLDGLF